MESESLLINIMLGTRKGVESGSFLKITLTAVLDCLTRLFNYFYFCAIAASECQGK